jgi:hypothetical protein
MAITRGSSWEWLASGSKRSGVTATGQGHRPRPPATTETGAGNEIEEERRAPISAARIRKFATGFDARGHRANLNSNFYQRTSIAPDGREDPERYAEVFLDALRSSYSSSLSPPASPCASSGPIPRLPFCCTSF